MFRMTEDPHKWLIICIFHQVWVEWGLFKNVFKVTIGTDFSIFMDFNITVHQYAAFLSNQNSLRNSFVPESPHLSLTTI